MGFVAGWLGFCVQVVGRSTRAAIGRRCAAGVRTGRYLAAAPCNIRSRPRPLPQKPITPPNLWEATCRRPRLPRGVVHTAGRGQGLSNSQAPTEPVGGPRATLQRRAHRRSRPRPLPQKPSTPPNLLEATCRRPRLPRGVVRTAGGGQAPPTKRAKCLNWPSCALALRSACRQPPCWLTVCGWLSWPCSSLARLLLRLRALPARPPWSAPCRAWQPGCA